jgi:WD40 repeat protein
MSAEGSNNNTAGFTLLEVIVGIFIISVIVIPVAIYWGQALDVVGELDYRQEAREYATNSINRLQQATREIEATNSGWSQDNDLVWPDYLETVAADEESGIEINSSQGSINVDKLTRQIDISNHQSNPNLKDVTVELTWDDKSLALQSLLVYKSPGSIGVINQLGGSNGNIYDLVLSSNQARVVTGGEDGVVRIWNLARGSLLAEFRGHGDRINAVDFSNDGTKIVSGSSDDTAKVWDLKTGRVITDFNVHTDNVNSVMFAPTGNRVVSASSDNEVHVWNSDTGTIATTFSGHTGSVRAAVFSPDGTKVVSGGYGDNIVRVWESGTGTELLGFDRHDGPIYDLAISHDGQQVVSSGQDDQVKVWDIETGDLSVDFDHGDSVRAVSFGPEDNLVFSGGNDNQIKIWNIAEDDSVASLLEHSGSVTSLEISNSGDRIISGSYDDTIKVWSKAIQ